MRYAYRDYTSSSTLPGAKGSHALLPSLLGCCLLLAAGCANEAERGPGRSPLGPATPAVGDPTSMPGGMPSGTPGPGPGPGVVAPGMVPVPAGAVVGPALARRLTNVEFLNTIQDLLHPQAPPSASLTPDTLTRGFDNLSGSLLVPPSTAFAYAEFAAEQAKSFQVPACAAPAAEADCAQSFIASFGKLAFRRPLTAEQSAQYLALYTDQKGRSDHAGGIRQVVQTMLQSPYFLYRYENGTEGAQRTLTQHEIASQLSYFLTATMPDSDLFQAADNGQLSSVEQITAQAQRLLGSEKAKPAIRRFVLGFSELLAFDRVVKDNATYPEFTAKLSGAMLEETSRFIDEVLWQGDGTYSTLFSAPYSFINSDLAPFYGVADPGQGGTFVKTNLPGTERLGLLTQASVLASHAKPGESSPIHRGKFVRVALLCQNLPAPPAVVPKLPPPSPNLTTRERITQHSADPACSGCHQLIDPIGFGLENYDGIGKFRTVESGMPVNAAGAFTSTSDLNGAFVGGTELAAKLAASREAQQCLAQRAYGWAFGRSVLDQELPKLAELLGPLSQSGLNIKEVMLAITRADNFRFRSFE
ncbi:MAG: DUF1592 domain-containing protein [Polyangiaceae bacterium]|nr:DUF1592 domain-containing protein [Polyangiaceae bacterium]